MQSSASLDSQFPGFVILGIRMRGYNGAQRSPRQKSSYVDEKIAGTVRAPPQISSVPPIKVEVA